MSSSTETADNQSNSENVQVSLQWIQIGLQIPMAVALHPFEYAKTLIQLGYEPVPPRVCRTLLGRPALSLPNIFEYVGCIRRKVGLSYMYRGVFPRILGVIAHKYVHREVSKVTAYCLTANDESEDSSNSDDAGTSGDLDDVGVVEQDRVLHFFQVTVRNMVAQGAAVVASHPFQVITVRMIAQFIGGEKAYNTMLSSIGDIYNESGLLGFFSGLVPRLIGEMLSLWICSCLTFVFNAYLVRDKELKAYTGAVMSLISSTVTYPYVLVSRVMMVNGSGMLASIPPNMPIYDGWTDCWNQLKAQNQLKRGSSLLWRYYTGPVVLKDGKPQAITLRNFQRPFASKY